MKIEWIEDFFALIETGNFSKAAEHRHVTQPAFSRRIRQLEEWLGVELIDRQSPRLALTAEARLYEPNLRAWLARLYALRSRMRSDATHGQRAVLTTQHTLTVSYLPRLLQYFRNTAPDARLQVRSSNRNDCSSDFQHGRADLMICSEQEGAPLLTSNSDTQRVALGTERLVPVSAADSEGKPLHEPHPESILPLIGYEQDSFFHRALASPYMLELQRRFDIELVCETAFTIGIKELTLAGLGIGWLPHGLIEEELKAGTLISLLGMLEGPILVVAGYCRTRTNVDAVDRLWELLLDKPPPI
ncbi:LysR family transcriptional regulator [Pistricoccus aurantiacus]|uniref:LysR family transcriptional regulator n=1 Tax=Pistricoccus aurantiacus TaxID=1883414 RepID=A0A5B8SU14_9GAMM|nr:LysR family transcriptional regulator [Pistricoccus aurantiacus]QEA40642.1 LysR family transcriptional regulator [Pistricoccus aurantiacus]